MNDLRPYRHTPVTTTPIAELLKLSDLSRSTIPQDVVSHEAFYESLPHTIELLLAMDVPDLEIDGYGQIYLTDYHSEYLNEW